MILLSGYSLLVVLSFALYLVSSLSYCSSKKFDNYCGALLQSVTLYFAQKENESAESYLDWFHEFVCFNYENRDVCFFVLERRKGKLIHLTRLDRPFCLLFSGTRMILFYVQNHPGFVILTVTNSLLSLNRYPSSGTNKS